MEFKYHLILVGIVFYLIGISPVLFTHELMDIKHLILLVIGFFFIIRGHNYEYGKGERGSPF